MTTQVLTQQPGQTGTEPESYITKEEVLIGICFLDAPRFIESDAVVMVARITEG